MNRTSVRFKPEHAMGFVVGLSDTQLRILQAVERLQSECGRRGVRMRDIACEAQVSYETVKLHLIRMEACGCVERSVPAERSRGRPYCYEVLVDVGTVAASALA